MAYGSMDVEGHLRTIFRRCVQCPPGPPSCPACAADETCQMNAESCTACASTVCLKIGSIPGQAAQSRSTPAGAIAGGVVGGVAFIVIVTFLIWRFCIRNKRKEWDDQVNNDEHGEKMDQLGVHREARQSAVGSIASTVLTRASNVIQIAYIPGVTNRSPPESPGLFVPPVPPLPIPTTDSSFASMSHFDQDRHFFYPEDLRDSTCSEFSYDTRPGMSPNLSRTSVATTMYRNNAIVEPLPAQQALRARAAVVSVRLGGSGSQNSQSTPSPPAKQAPKPFGNTNSSIVARNLVARPVEVKKKVLTSDTSSALADSSNHEGEMAGSNQIETSFLDDLSSEEESLPEGQDNRQSIAVTMIDDSPISPVGKKRLLGSSSTDSPSSLSVATPSRHTESQASQAPTPVPRGEPSARGLNLRFEEALTRPNRELSRERLGNLRHPSKRDSGPFSDDNELKENH